MKERLDRENIEALAAYRFQRAEETLKEIPYLKQQGYAEFNLQMQQNSD